MKCKFCGKENIENAKFCEVCGRPIGLETEDGFNQKLENDRKEIIDKKVNKSDPVVKNKNSLEEKYKYIKDDFEDKKEKGSKKKIIILAGLACVIFIGILSYFYLSSNDKLEDLYQAKKYEEIVELYEEGKLKAEDRIYLANSFFELDQKDKALVLYRIIFKDMPFSLKDENYFVGYKNFLAYSYEKNQISLEKLLTLDFSKTDRKKELDDFVNSFKD